MKNTINSIDTSRHGRVDYSKGEARRECSFIFQGGEWSKINIKKLMIIGLLSLPIFYSGCTTKAKIVDGKRYTQTWGSNEWHYDYEIKK